MCVTLADLPFGGWNEVPTLRRSIADDVQWMRGGGSDGRWNREQGYQGMGSKRVEAERDVVLQTTVVVMLLLCVRFETEQSDVRMGAVPSVLPDSGSPCLQSVVLCFRIIRLHPSSSDDVH